jgi:sarcosine oxidase / L-pipecolate oxidase
MSSDVTILGGGILGVTAACELAERGASVVVVDRGKVPHVDAASTDLSKLVRGDYGRDTFYTELFEDALARFRELDARAGACTLHETGLLFLASQPITDGSFEGDSFAALSGRGYRLERLDATEIARRFPAWGRAGYVDGYVNPVGGWVESGRVVELCVAEAERRGVRFEAATRARIDGRTLITDQGTLAAGTLVVACGAATPYLVPEVSRHIVAVGQPVFHFAARAGFDPPEFLPWAADIGRTGWYGFASHAGVVKIANHGAGVPLDPREPWPDAREEEPLFRRFLEQRLPSLADAAVVRTRRCVYSDSFDGDFLIDRVREGVVVAAGGSGHAFKFGPSLGALVADVVTGRQNRFAERFRMRPVLARKTEQARFLDGSSWTGASESS